MAQLFKKNEAVQAPFFKNGVTLDFYTITFTGWSINSSDAASTSTVAAGGVSSVFYGADTAQSTAIAARNPLVVALEAIQAKTSIEIIGTPVVTSGNNTTVNIAVAALGGGYVTDDYTSYQGLGNTQIAFADYLTNLVHNGGTYQGFAMSNCSVAATTF